MTKAKSNKERRNMFLSNRYYGKIDEVYQEDGSYALRARVEGATFPRGDTVMLPGELYCQWEKHKPDHVEYVRVEGKGYMAIALFNRPDEKAPVPEHAASTNGGTVVGVHRHAGVPSVLLVVQDDQGISHEVSAPTELLVCPGDQVTFTYALYSTRASLVELVSKGIVHSVMDADRKNKQEDLQLTAVFKTGKIKQFLVRDELDRRYMEVYEDGGEHGIDLVVYLPQSLQTKSKKYKYAKFVRLIVPSRRIAGTHTVEHHAIELSTTPYVEPTYVEGLFDMKFHKDRKYPRDADGPYKTILGEISEACPTLNTDYAQVYTKHHTVLARVPAHLRAALTSRHKYCVLAVYPDKAPKLLHVSDVDGFDSKKWNDDPDA